MENKSLQIAAALLLILILIALADPFMLLMPPPVALFALLGAAALVAVFAGAVMNERAGDEREEAHRAAAGRAAYLAGLIVLTIGLLMEGFGSHHIDPWLLAALGTMILARLCARLRIDSRN